jgi:Kinesin motor domain
MVESPQGKRSFIFDRVFNETVGQEGIMQWLSDSLDSFVQGYNVSLLAYGQSGSGKSYTMGTSGPAEQNDPRQMGTETS